MGRQVPPLPGGCGCARCGGPEAREGWLRARALASRRELARVERPDARNRVVEPEEGWRVPVAALGPLARRVADRCERASYDPHWCRAHHADYAEGRPACEARRAVARIRPRSAWAAPSIDEDR